MKVSEVVKVLEVVEVSEFVLGVVCVCVCQHAEVVFSNITMTYGPEHTVKFWFEFNPLLFELPSRNSRQWSEQCDGPGPGSLGELWIWRQKLEDP